MYNNNILQLDNSNDPDFIRWPATLHIVRPLSADGKDMPIGVRGLAKDISFQGSCQSCGVVYVDYKKIEGEAGWVFSQNTPLNNREYAGEKIVNEEIVYYAPSLYEAFLQLRKEICKEYEINEADEEWVSF